MYQVLIVDDEEIVCRGMAQFVKWEKCGFEVAGMASGVDEAIHMLKKLSVDVIFTDIRMPGKSGIDLLKYVQEEYPDIQTIVLSGYSDFDYAKEAIRYGAKEYLTKPVNLGEVEVLLQRIEEKLNRMHQEARIHSGHMEGLLLSIARGYSEPEVEKYKLPSLKDWYGVSVCLTQKNLEEGRLRQEKECMKKQIGAVTPEAIILESSLFALFVIAPVKDESEFTYFLSMMEQVCTEENGWGIGISRKKHGISSLSEAFKETELATRYIMADTRKKVIAYKNIEKLFSEKSSQIQEILSEFLCRLQSGEEKAVVIQWLKNVLLTMENAENMTVMEMQTVCIRFLIEVSGHFHDVGYGKEDAHDRLNSALQKLLCCEKSQDVIKMMLSYLDWIAQQMETMDQYKMTGGVIAEIQSFIRQNYQENISLNMLTELFYMHPNYLSRLFKEKTGMNFFDYLVKIRMEKAKELVKTSDYKMIEICGLVGYDNPRSFSKAFKHYTGMTPKEYRESQV